VKGSSLGPRRTAWLAVTVTAAVLAALQLGGEDMALALRYDRNLVAAGEWWRWFTASFVHAGWSHLGVNLAGLALAGLTIGEVLGTRRYTLCLAVSLPAVTLGLWLWSPGVQWYLGASGVLHGLFVTGGLLLAARRRPEGPGLLAVVAAKLAWEQVFGPIPGSAATAGVRVIVDAHLYGALGGLLAAALAAMAEQLSRFLRGKEVTRD
jgi:rhomboid family GlyGly-CTERM serine protease